MANLPSVGKAEGKRARRWDAIVLGSSPSGLVAAARLGMAGKRVLVVEEAATRDAFPGLREPFFLAGAQDEGVCDTLLRELGLPLVERRRLEPATRAFQLVGSDLRADVGKQELTRRELVLWDISNAQVAHNLTQALCDASEAERQTMLEAPVVRIGRRIGRRARGISAYRRGLPPEVTSASPRLAQMMDLQVRALSNLAESEPSPEARARLLGSVMAGGTRFRHGPPWLMGMLRGRVESAFGEFRSPNGPFRIVSSGDQPGISVAGTDELWLGHVLILATPPSLLAGELNQEPLPSFLVSKRTTRRRVKIHLRVPKASVPEAMGLRALLINDRAGDDSATNGSTASPFADPISLAVFPDASRPGYTDLVSGRIAGPEDDRRQVEDSMEDAIRKLMPFAGTDMQRCPVEHPRWDDDGWLEDPPRGLGWPTELVLRVSSRPPVYRLDRSEIAGLGLEGDLLLGWRAGDAIAGEIS